MSSASRRARRLARRVLPSRDAGKPAAKPAASKKPAAAKKDTAPKAPPSPATQLARSLERGKSLEEAVVAQTRAFVRAGEHHHAESLAESLRRREETAALGRLAAGIVAFHRGYLDLAWHELSALPRDQAAQRASTEYARSGVHVARGDFLREVAALADADPPQIKARAWFNLMGPVFGIGEADLARRLFAIFDRHVEEDSNLWKDARKHRDWMRPWMDGAPSSPAGPPPPGGRRTFAIVDYGHPGRSRGSANIGDHVQSIAAMGHLVRQQDVRFHGDARLTALLERLRERTKPERRLTGASADLEVRTIHRDASEWQEVAEDTWVLAFGWYMHALFRARHGFPLHRNLRPIFISFHCNKRDLLTPEAVDYLKRYGPVGCRDWTTVYLLLSMGVPAFFSGCLTTTTDTVFPKLPEHDRPPADAPPAYVDMPPDSVPQGAQVYKHSDDEVRVRPFAGNVEIALDRLESYRREHGKTVTSRLHCYLPLRSIGAPAEFEPKNKSDIRFDGLLGIDDGQFEAIRSGILDKLERVMHAIITGMPEDTIYELWRDITREDVAAAQRKLNAPAEAPATPTKGSADPLSTSAQPGAVHCVVRGADLPFEVLKSSIAEHASRPVEYIRVPDDVGNAELADRLPGLDRVVVLPLPAVATRDIAELADLDLGDRALAAPRTKESGFHRLHDAALGFGDRTDRAAELRRTAHARHAFDFDAFRDDVLVIDLNRLREQEIANPFGLGDLDLLHYAFGPNRADVPPEWAYVPGRSLPLDFKLIHWADPVKPWQPELTPERERWRAYADALSR